MKKTLLLLLFISSATSFSQAPGWAWFKSIYGSTGSTEDRAVSLTTDSTGNVFIIGHYGSPSMTLGTTVLSNSSTNTRDMYLAKYSPTGSLVWAKSFGGLYNDNPSSITTDSSGNLIFVGNFDSPTITFGSTTLTNSGMSDIFIVKFDTTGNVIWAKKAGGSSQDTCKSVKVNPSGEILLTGSFSSATCAFGTSSLTNLGSTDVFIAKYNTSGNIIWAKRIGGTSNEDANDITTDLNGNIFITGSFGSPTLSDGTNSLTNTGVASMFLFKYDTAGTFKWSKKWSGSSLNRGVGVATDSSGNVILAGNYGDTSINFDGLILNCMYVSSAIVKYNSNGNVMWAKTCSDGKYDVTSIAVDSQGSTYLSGTTICPAIFFGPMVLINSGSDDSVLMKYDVNGNELWGKIVGGNSWEYGAKTIVDQSDNSYLLGSFLSSSISFDGTLLNNSGTGSNSNQIFFSKLNSLLDTAAFENDLSFTVFPNPVSSNSMINFNEDLDNASLTLFDISGKEIRRQVFSGKQLTFEKGNLSAGIYFIKISTNDKKSNIKKIVIE
jgi:hypothetical protein